MLQPGSGRLGNWGACEETGAGEKQSGAGQLSWGGADTHSTRQVPKYIYFQAANLPPKNLFFKACSHLPKENMSFIKKPRKSNTDRQEHIAELQPLCFYLSQALEPCGETTLSLTCFINSQLLIVLFPLLTVHPSFFPTNTALTSLKFLQK